MPAEHSSYQAILEQVQLTTMGLGVRATTVTRLALLVVGRIAGRACVLGQIATEIWALHVTRARTIEHVERRPRRALNARWLTSSTCYEPVMRQVLPWERVIGRGQTVFLALDDSSQAARIQLPRVRVVYWGTGVPLAGAVWEQNVPLEDGRAWKELPAVLDRVAASLPPGVHVVVLADRAFAVAPFVDRIAAHGWDWIVRVTAAGAGRFRDADGVEHEPRTLIRRYGPGPLQRWRAPGQMCKKAGWGRVAVVACWEPGAREPLVVATSLPPSWEGARVVRSPLLDRGRVSEREVPRLGVGGGPDPGRRAS